MSDSDSDFMDDSSPKAKKAPAAKKITPKKKKEDGKIPSFSLLFNLFYFF